MRLLYVTSNRLGDAVLSTGLLAHLARRHADLRATVVCGPVAESVFATMPFVTRVIPVRKRKRGAHWLDIWRAVVGTRWDMVVDLRGSALAWTLRAGTRHVPGRAARSAAEAVHRVTHLGGLFDLDPPPAPCLWEDERSRERAAALIPDGPPVLALGPGANWRGKQWRAERFAELGLRLTGPTGPLPNARVAVFAAAEERPQGQVVLDALPGTRRIDLIGAGSPLLAHACLKRCAFFVGNDSGLMHLAAASAIPTLGLFGPSQPEHYAPWGPMADHCRTTASFQDLVQAPGYDFRTTDTLMDSLSVDAAEAAARALWRRCQGSVA